MQEPVQNNIQKLRVYIILAVVNVVAFFFYIRMPPAQTDYSAFYMAGQIARSFPAEVYDWNSQLAHQMKAFTHFVPFFHPPHELLLFGPFSILPFSYSLLAWRLFSTVCLIGSALFLSKATGITAPRAVAMIASMFPIGICLMLGQDSLLLLLITAWCFYLLRRDADLAAGLVMSLALFKPQLPLIIAFSLFAIRRIKFVLAFTGASTVLTLASIAYVGRTGVRDLLKITKLSESVLPVWGMPTIRGLIARIGGDHPRIASALLVAVLAVFYFVWRKSRSLEFAFSSAICVYVCSALHLYTHDLVVLAIPLILFSGLPQRRWDALLLVAFFSVPLYLILLFYNLTSLILIPSVCLCLACYRLEGEKLAIAG